MRLYKHRSNRKKTLLAFALAVVKYLHLNLIALEYYMCGVFSTL